MIDQTISQNLAHNSQNYQNHMSIEGEESCSCVFVVLFLHSFVVKVC